MAFSGMKTGSRGRCWVLADEKPWQPPGASELARVGCLPSSVERLSALELNWLVETRCNQSPADLGTAGVIPVMYTLTGTELPAAFRPYLSSPPVSRPAPSFRS